MSSDNLYQRVIEVYRKTGSVKKTAETVDTTLVRAQRILITEGLWSSPTSEKILDLFQKGKTVSEIAGELFISEKTVQAYLPYTRTGKGYGGDERSMDAIKSGEYRKRMHRAAESQVSKDVMKMERDELDSKTAKKTTVKKSERDDVGKAIADFSKYSVADLYNKHMLKRPEVLRLNLALDMKYVDDDDMEILRKYGKVEKGISREILVPADITLHALNYVLLRAFGWQNSHLHHFRFPAEVFQKLTGGKNKPDEDGNVENDGLFADWVKLCGVYFRFPCADFDDLYWDDDYVEGESIKSWMRRKYTGPYHYLGSWEHYECANSEARGMMQEYPMIKKHLSFSEWEQIKASGKDPSKLRPKMIPIKKATIQDIGMMFDGRLDELLERIPVAELMIPENAGVDLDVMDKIEVLSKRQERSEDEFPVYPVSKELIYAYDYGDDWEVRIRLTDCYYTENCDDAVKESDRRKNCVAPISDAKVLADMSAYDMNNRKLGKAMALKVSTVATKRRPVCVALDGMSVMDDVGGIFGYVEFLRTIHGDDPEEREESRDWARWMGWAGRMNKPETLL